MQSNRQAQVPHCDACGKLAARKTGGSLKKKQFCMQCARNIAPTEAESLSPVPYIPNAVKAHYKHIEEARYLAGIKMASKDRILKLKRFKEDSNALLIQRIWRGSKSRRGTRDFVQDRRLWIQHRNTDAQHRTKLTYRIACFFGRGALFESDTPVETVMKQVPFWARGTVRDVVRGRFVSECIATQRTLY